jgi:hypothetical protein
MMKMIICWWWIFIVLKTWQNKSIRLWLVDKAKQSRTQQGQNHITTPNTAKVTLITGKLRQGIRQPRLKTGESEEERAVHADVTKGPYTNTLQMILIAVTPSTIETSFLKVEGRPSLREVAKQTTSVRGSKPPWVPVPKAQNE